MKKIVGGLAAFLLLVAGVAIAQNVSNYREQGGARTVIGGSLDVVSGGDLDIESGGALKIAGTTVTSTAAELNAVDGGVAGTVVASKVVVVDASKHIGDFGNVTVGALIGGDNALGITGQAQATTVDGGTVVITGAASIAGATGAGGAASLTGGASGSTDDAGGAASIAGGAGTGTGLGGAASVTSGVSANVTAGTGAATGAATVTSGAPGTATTGTAGASGAATLSSAAGGVASGAAGTGGAAGAVAVTGGAGGATTDGAAGVETGGAGADVTVTAGAGGALNAASTGTGGAGGDLTITPGAGGAAASGTAGATGTIYLRPIDGLPMMTKMAAPVADSGADTNMTEAQLLSGIHAKDPAGAVAWQVPNGTEISAAVGAGLAVGDSFEFTVINTGNTTSEDITLTVDTGVTFVGSAVLAPAADDPAEVSTGTWRFRNTGANTWIGYRIG